jgi:hypothetical protein
MALSHARLTHIQVLGPTLMVLRSMLGARVGIPARHAARFRSVTYARPFITHTGEGNQKGGFAP